MTNGIYILANDVVFDHLVALLNSLEVNGAKNIPVCIIPYDNRLKKVQVEIATRPQSPCLKIAIQSFSGKTLRLKFGKLMQKLKKFGNLKVWNQFTIWKCTENYVVSTALLINLSILTQTLC
jgi:hypothetical protein